jgi:hypothetical protein
MNMLFDSLGPEWRAPDVVEAIRLLGADDAPSRGAVFTRPEVVVSILDLCGYTSDRPLHLLRLLEPSFGDGDFLFPAVERLIAAYSRAKPDFSSVRTDLVDAVRAVELHRDSYACTKRRVSEQLVAAGIGEVDAAALSSSWLVCDDFLLSDLSAGFDLVVGNPPYVRQERIPSALLAEYRSRFSTLYDRADLYVPFFERALDLLAPGGVLGFICANRWLKNKYGGPLRSKISEGFHLAYFIDMEGVDAFHADVIAYPAITVVRRPKPGDPLHQATRVASSAALRQLSLPTLARALVRSGEGTDLVDEVMLDGVGDAPWLLDDVHRLKMLRRLEANFPMLENVGCKVGIGVATGCDRVFIDDFQALPVEPERKLPLVMARDLLDGRIDWHGKGVLNPFEADGSLASLEAFPRFAAYLHAHREAVAARHVANRSGSGWYRTIDRIYPELVQRPKLLVPDIKGEASFVLDEGRYYPHHNLYYVTSDTWDLAALRTVLRSSVSMMTVATYCTRMAGGFLRFQAQYLRRIRLPKWEMVPQSLRAELIAVTDSLDQTVIDAPVFEMYGLNLEEAMHIRRVADDAQVTARNKRRIQ